MRFRMDLEAGLTGSADTSTPRNRRDGAAVTTWSFHGKWSGAGSQGCWEGTCSGRTDPAPSDRLTSLGPIC